MKAVSVGASGRSEVLKGSEASVRQSDTPK
jgi:hypothetical protein